MNKSTQRPAKKPKVVVIKNALSRQEADAIVDSAIKRGGPFMSLAETIAHAAQLQKADVAAE